MSTGNHRPQMESEALNAGFQIAPMIDVVFVIMLFFMVMAASVKVEHELKVSLPGQTQLVGTPIVNLDEVFISIAEDGMVAMNDEEFDSPAQANLPELTATLKRLSKDAEYRQGKVLVTLESEPQAKYERIVQVMNSLAAARIANISFSTTSD